MSPFANKLPFKFSELHGALLLVIFHVVGLIGMSSSFVGTFIKLTPFNLILSLFVLLAFHPKYDKRFWLFSLTTVAIGIGVEWIGVHTGMLFGSYYYTSVFGYRLDGIPILIGINWLMLTIICGELASMFLKKKPLRILVGALLMLALDFIIEPVAIRYEFWVWQGDHIPWTNYLTWFIVGLPLQFVYQWSKMGNNLIAKWLFISQVLFFIGLQIK
jgi:bisanhydrobacterioruberin hydratase